jgi:hypothetical protein
MMTVKARHYRSCKSSEDHRGEIPQSYVTALPINTLNTRVSKPNTRRTVEREKERETKNNGDQIYLIGEQTRPNAIGAILHRVDSNVREATTRKRNRSQIPLARIGLRERDARVLRVLTTQFL